MKLTRYILIAGLFIIAALSVWVFAVVWSKPDGKVGDFLAVKVTNNNRTNDVSMVRNGQFKNNFSEAIANSLSGYADVCTSSSSKIENSISQDHSISDDKTQFQINQKHGNVSVTEDKVTSSFRELSSPGIFNQTYNEEQPGPVDSNTAAVRLSYLKSSEVYGQDGEELPSPEKVLASKAQNILRNYKDRNAEAVIISEEEEIDSSETASSENSSNDSVGMDSAGITDVAAAGKDTDSTIIKLAEQNTSDNQDDTKLQTERLLAALAESNPVDVRLQAIYLLGDVAPEEAKKFLNDKEDVVRCEAERIAGILPQD